MSQYKIEAGTGQHIGDRKEQQDRAALFAAPKAPGYMMAVLADGMQAWLRAGLPVERGLSGVMNPPKDVLTMGTDRTWAEAIQYLRWEEELGKKYGIGGAKPYITIRSLADDRDEKMIVVRHSETEDQESTGIAAGDMMKEQAREHPGAQAVLARFAEDKLFELRIQNAPATVMYATTPLTMAAAPRVTKGHPMATAGTGVTGPVGFYPLEWG